MKNKRYLILTIFMLISLLAGLQLIISPEDVGYWALRVIGLIWVFESCNYALELIKMYIENKTKYKKNL